MLSDSTLLNYIAVRVDDGKANKINGLIIDSDWGHEGKHMTHNGIIVKNGTDLDLEIGSEIWFDHRFKWVDNVFDSLGWNGKDEKGINYYLIKKEEYKSYVRVCNGRAVNGYIGIQKKKRDNVTSGGIIILDTVAPVDDRGTVIKGSENIPDGTKIIYAQDNDYPSNEMESDWIKHEGNNIVFTHEDYIFAIDDNGELKPYGSWNIMEALDDDDEWENFGGLYLPRKEKATKGLGVVIKSKGYDEGTKLIYAKRGYNSFEFNDKKYYAVKNDNVLWEYDDLVAQVKRSKVEG